MQFGNESRLLHSESIFAREEQEKTTGAFPREIE